MNPFAKRRLGSSPVSVTQLGLGGAQFGNVFSDLTDQAASDTVAAAYTAGIRYFDSAPLYGRGLSESRVGAGLAPFNRASLVISSKVGYTLVPRAGSAGPFDNDTRFDYSRDGVLRSLESSLRRLRTDRLDIVLIHDPDESVSNELGFDPYGTSHFAEVMDGAYPALHELRAQGVIGALGAGMNQWQMLSDFARAGDFDCFMLAGRYTLLEQGALATFLPLCAQKNIGVIIAGPYNSGILATGAAPSALWNYKPAPPALLARVAAIQAVCERHGVSLQAAALQFPFGHPAVASVIPGSRSVAELEANVQLLQHPIPAACWAELQSLSLLDPAAPLPAGA